MFTENKYTRWYYNIITSTKDRSGGYVERHHIVPKSMGGLDTYNNLVDLTAREHFVCHWLLTKMTQGQDKEKMVYALRLMCKRKLHREQVTSRVYAHTKQAHADNMSRKHRGKKLNENQKLALYNANKGRSWTDEQRETVSRKLKGRVFTEEARNKMSEAAKRRKRTPHTEATKAKIAASNSKPMTEERKQKISAAHKGKTISAESIAKRTASRKANMSNYPL